MDESKGTSKAVVVSAILHIGIVAFLFLAILPCTSYENFITALGLPASMNPITCSKPLQLQGQVIQAVFIGPTGSPPPKAVKAKPVPNTVPPPPAVPPPTPPQPETPVVKTLPPPPKQVDVKDQEKVVEDAPQKADDARQLQDEKERQRQSEIDAQAAKKQEQKKKIDALFAKLDDASAQTKTSVTKAQQAKQQMEDLKNASDDSQPDLPNANQVQTGNNSATSDLSDAYGAAIQNAVKQNWIGPDNIPPKALCLVHIVQLPGGDVISAKVDSSCPYDEAGRKSVEDAVYRTHQLPYKGFESVFTRTVDINFQAQ
jgi:colicin import membrane protein